MLKYKKLCPVQSGLLKRNIVDLVGEVDWDMALYVREALTRLELRDSPDIEVRISSNGGSIQCGLDIYDALRLYKGKKTALGQARTNSMSAVILQACDIRRSTKHTAFLIHHAISEKKFSLSTLTDEKKMQQEIETLTRSTALMIDIIAARTGKSRDEVNRKCAEDKAMSADEALAFGLIDEII